MYYEPKVNIHAPCDVHAIAIAILNVNRDNDAGVTRHVTPLAKLDCSTD